MALVAASSMPAAAMADDNRTYWIAAGDDPVLQVRNALGRFEITKRGRRVTVRLDGKRLPSGDIRRSGRVYQVLDASDRTILLFGVFSGPGDGQVVYSPHLDPHALQGRTGLDIEEKEYPELRDVLPDWVPDQLVSVRKVALGSASARAGLHEGQLLLSCNGQAISGEASLYGCFSQSASQLDLEVFDAGTSRTLRVSLPPPSDWIAPEQAERIFAQVLGR